MHNTVQKVNQCTPYPRNCTWINKDLLVVCTRTIEYNRVNWCINVAVSKYSLKITNLSSRQLKWVYSRIVSGCTFRVDVIEGLARILAYFRGHTRTYANRGLYNGLKFESCCHFSQNLKYCPPLLPSSLVTPFKITTAPHFFYLLFSLFILYLSTS